MVAVTDAVTWAGVVVVIIMDGHADVTGVGTRVKGAAFYFTAMHLRGGFATVARSRSRVSYLNQHRPHGRR